MILPSNPIINHFTFSSAADHKKSCDGAMKGSTVSLDAIKLATNSNHPLFPWKTITFSDCFYNECLINSFDVHFLTRVKSTVEAL